MGPLTGILDLTQGINLLIAFLIGIGFGFALEQAGFSSSRKLAGMFYGYDATVLKVFFTAAIVWFILVWLEKADNPGSERYLLIIMYLVGLAIGVHLLMILALPAVLMIVYFKYLDRTGERAYSPASNSNGPKRCVSAAEIWHCLRCVVSAIQRETT